MIPIPKYDRIVINTVGRRSKARFFERGGCVGVLEPCDPTDIVARALLGAETFPCEEGYSARKNWILIVDFKNKEFLFEECSLPFEESIIKEIAVCYFAKLRGCCHESADTA